MKYILNKCLVENENGEIIWMNQKPEGEFLKFQTMLDSSCKYDLEVYKHFNLDCNDQFKIVIYLKDENKKRAAQYECVKGVQDMFNFFDCGYELVDNSQHKGEVS